MRIFLHDDFCLHRPPIAHPENPGRLETIMKSLEARGLRHLVSRCECTPSEQLTRSMTTKVHAPGYVSFMLNAMKKESYSWVDEDTYLSPGTLPAVSRAMCCIDALINKALAGDKEPKLLLVRPPGHHAGVRGAAMGCPTLGFCIFNNVAVAAKVLSESGGVLIIDFDAHHGNGTQEIFYEDKRVVHIDIHEHPASLYPGTGWPGQTGSGEALGTKINVILPPGSADDVLEDVVQRVEEYLKEYSYEFVLVSAGFDAFLDDGLSHLRLSEYSFHILGDLVRRVGEGRPILIFLEGGYGLGLERGLPAFLLGLLGEPARRTWVKTISDEKVWVKYRSLREELEGLILPHRATGT